MQTGNQSIRVKISGQEINIDSRFVQVSELIKTLVESDPGNVYEFDESLISKDQLEIIQSYYQRHNFSPPSYKLTSKDPQVVFPNEQDRELAMNLNVFQGNKLKSLLTAAQYIQVNELKDLLVSRIALEFYVSAKKYDESAQGLKQRFGNHPLTIQQYKEYIQELSMDFLS